MNENKTEKPAEWGGKLIKCCISFGKNLSIWTANIILLFIIIGMFLFLLHLWNQSVLWAQCKCDYIPLISNKQPSCEVIEWKPRWFTENIWGKFWNLKWVSELWDGILNDVFKYVIKLISNGGFYLIIFGGLLGFWYRKPYILIRKSLFITDERPPITSPLDERIRIPQWVVSAPRLFRSVFIFINIVNQPWRYFRRSILVLMFYANIISLPSVRLLAHFIWHSATSRFLAYLFPRTIFRQAQIYIETKLFVRDENIKDYIREAKIIEHEYSQKEITKNELEENISEIFKTLSDADKESIKKNVIWKLYIEHYEKNHPITCTSCFDIFDKSDEIERYFKAQQDAEVPIFNKFRLNTCLNFKTCANHKEKSGTDNELKFQSQFRFKSGFLAPTYLVSGPLSEYNEDWTLIIDAYQDKIDYLEDIVRPDEVKHLDPLHHLPELRKLQSFIWDCWVQWGPSIPICESDKWNTGVVALQFGYGDENNSLPICYKYSEDKFQVYKQWKYGNNINELNVNGIQEKITSAINREDEQRCQAGERKYSQNSKKTGVAWPVKVEGTLHWLSKDKRNTDFCQAQNKDDDYEKIFVASSIEPHTHENNTEGLLFYSAYIWVLIAICKDNGTPLHDYPVNTNKDKDGRIDERWRGLIPFFQHGNIADASVYENIKQELAVKTVDTMIRQIEKTQKIEDGLKEGEKIGLKFTYVAAFDDNGDFKDDVRTPNLVTYSGESILCMMNKELIKHVEKDSSIKRINLEPALKGFCMAANDIPEIVQAYLDQIDK